MMKPFRFLNRGYNTFQNNTAIFQLAHFDHLFNIQNRWYSNHDQPRQKDNKSDLIVVLDLDECLIHSKFFESTDDIYRQYEADRARRTKNSTDEDAKVKSSFHDSFYLTLPGGEGVQVHKRPNLDYFLEQVTSRYDTYIFTAAMEVYASPLLNVLDPQHTKFIHRFYREHCAYHPHVQAYVKDLSQVARHEKFRSTTSAASSKRFNNPFRRMVLVDNNPLSFIANPQNGILVSNFYDDANDDTLNAVLDLLFELEVEEDVRPYLNDKFALEQALYDATGGFVWNSDRTHHDDDRMN